MKSNEKIKLTRISKVPLFSQTMHKLTINEKLSEQEKQFILSAAILFIQSYQNDRRLTSYIDFAYYIILKYSLLHKDFKPLFDLSINIGFYPIANDIIKHQLLKSESIDDRIIFEAFSQFKNSENYIETFEQNIQSKEFLTDKTNEKCYIAPTSFGKSSLIIKAIQHLPPEDKKIAIIVPTKSLLMQTSKNIRLANLSKKLFYMMKCTMMRKIL